MMEPDVIKFVVSCASTAHEKNPSSTIYGRHYVNSSPNNWPPDNSSPTTGPLDNLSRGFRIELT